MYAVHAARNISQQISCLSSFPTLIFFLALDTIRRKPIVLAEFDVELDLFLQVKYLLRRLFYVNGSRAQDSTSRTRPISAIDFDLYEASAFARAKWICPSLSYVTGYLPEVLTKNR